MKGKKKLTNSAGTPVPAVDLRQIEQLLSFMVQHGLEEFEYSRGDLSIRLRKPAANSNSASPRAFVAPEIIVADAAAGQDVDPQAPSAAQREPAGESIRGEEIHVVKSPIVGTFYESPSPGAEAFVKVGDHVETGQVLCIIEAMKLMNEIESDLSGDITRIFVENGQPVEYGESLFAIRPSRKK